MATPDVCSIHFTPLVQEKGGPTAPTIRGRLYCPTCQETLNNTLDAQETRNVMTENTTETTTETIKVIPLRLVAEYQVYGDVQGKEFMDAVLGGAVETGAITKYEVTGSFATWHGIQLVTFTVDLNEYHSDHIREITTLAADGRTAIDDATRYGEDILNRIVGDTDVSVRAISWDDPEAPEADDTSTD